MCKPLSHTALFEAPNGNWPKDEASKILLPELFGTPYSKCFTDSLTPFAFVVLWLSQERLLNQGLLVTKPKADLKDLMDQLGGFHFSPQVADLYHQV